MRDFRWQCFTEAVVAELHDSHDVDTENFRFEAPWRVSLHNKQGMILSTDCLPIDKGEMKSPMDPMVENIYYTLGTFFLGSNFSQSRAFEQKSFKHLEKKNHSKPEPPQPCTFV